MITAAQPPRSVSRHWGEDIIGVPAMIMAFGIFLKSPAPYLLERTLGPGRGDRLVDGLVLVLGSFTLYVAVRFAAQWRLDRRLLLGRTPGHFRIGTWAAGVNVLASLLHPLSPPLSLAAFLVGLLLWLLYLVWMVDLTVHGVARAGRPDGSAFLTTVATQSVAIAFMVVLPEQVDTFLGWLILVNVLGIVFYWIVFALVWVTGRLVEPLLDWKPQNNVTHGALSITMLAAQMLEARIPGSLPYFHLVIQVAWVGTGLLLVFSLCWEIRLAWTGRKPLLGFRITNYARNFTYGMFFACSWYGYTYPHPSLMKSVLDPTVLTVFALLVLLLNAWELAHQVVRYSRTRAAEGLAV